MNPIQKKELTTMTRVLMLQLTIQANNHRVEEGTIGKVSQPLHRIKMVLGGVPDDNAGPILSAI